MSNKTTARPEARGCRGARLRGADRLSKRAPVEDHCAKSDQGKPMCAGGVSAHLVEQIVVPTDFSPADLRLAHKAAMLGEVFGTKVTLLHVIDINDPRWVSYCGSAAEFTRQLKLDAEKHMQELVTDLAHDGIKVESLTVEGLPGREILNLLQQACLLIIGKPVSKPFWRLFSKRTIQQLLEEARCKLMICPSGGAGYE